MRKDAAKLLSSKNWPFSGKKGECLVEEIGREAMVRKRVEKLEGEGQEEGRGETHI